MSRDERGSAAVEFALVVPLFVLLVSVMVGAGRVWLARATVEQAAGAAARAASLARAPQDAVAAATEMAELQVVIDGRRCGDLAVDVDARALSTPGPGRVSATVSCAVSLADVLVPGWPGELRLAASASAVVDSYRARS